jgi:hypothetical protein
MLNLYMDVVVGISVRVHKLWPRCGTLEMFNGFFNQGPKLFPFVMSSFASVTLVYWWVLGMGAGGWGVVWYGMVWYGMVWHVTGIPLREHRRWCL